MGRREWMGGAGAFALASGLAGKVLAQEGSKKRKIIAINGSPRKGMTTSAALQLSLTAARELDPSVETELIELGDLSVPSQLAAGQPLREGEIDDFPAVDEKLRDPTLGGLLIGSPVYFNNMTALCKAFLDRCFSLRKDGFLLRDKVVGVLSVGGARNGGQETTVQSIHAALLSQDVILVGTGKPFGRLGATLWNQQETIEQDSFGKDLAGSLGRRVAEVMLSMNSQ